MDCLPFDTSGRRKKAAERGFNSGSGGNKCSPIDFRRVWHFPLLYANVIHFERFGNTIEGEINLRRRDFNCDTLSALLALRLFTSTHVQLFI